MYKHRAVGRSENPGVPALFGGHNLPPTLIETGLTNLQKSGGGTPWARVANFVKKPFLFVNVTYLESNGFNASM